MSWIIFWGALAATLEVSSLISRAIETRTAKSVTGLSAGFLWFGIELNLAWGLYGAILRNPAIFFPSMLTIIVFGYGLYRIHCSGRTQKQPLLVALSVGVVIAAAVLYQTEPVMNFIALVGSVYILPQLIRIWRTHDVAGIAPKAWIFTLLFSLVWLTYGIVDGIIPLIVANGIQAALTLLVLLGYWIHRGSKSVAV